MGEDKVLYVQCPHCGKGWYGKIKYLEVEINGVIYKGSDVPENIISKLRDIKVLKCVISGLSDTDVTSEITCLNCHNKYVPYNSPNRMVMDEWIAHKLVTVTGK